MIKNDLDGKYRPSALTAYERYEALIPILSEASEAYMRLFSERPTPKRDDDVNGRLTSLFEKVASNSVMSVEEVRRAFQGYTVKGLSGLMTPTPFNARDLVLQSRGTWELSSRVTNGGNTQCTKEGSCETMARSKLYYEMVSDTEMKELCTMWNDENHYPREQAVKQHSLGAEDTFFIASLTTAKLKQIDDYTVEYTSSGEFCGNHAHYKKPLKGASRVLMMHLDGEPTFISVPEAYAVHANGKKVPATGTFLLLRYTGGLRARRFVMSGLPPMFGDTRTMDVVDSYVKVSDQQPLIGGWEPIQAYYTRLRDVRSDELIKRAGVNGGAHGFYADGRDTLKKYA